MGKTMLYVWQDLDSIKYLDNSEIDLNTCELKFGDHFSDTDIYEEAVEETYEI